MIEPAKSFDLAAEEYERTRPDYPDAVLDLVPVDEASVVADIGAGTGKLTRVLARRYRRVIAVEPLDRMRAILARVVPDAEARVGTAEALPLADGVMDAVFAAQAFHWFDADRALPEIARVLRPGGVLAVVWNGHEESRANPLPAAYLDYLETLHADAELRRNPPPPCGEVIARGPFGDAHEAAIPHDHVIDRQGLLDNARTVSWIATHPDRERALRRIADLLPEGTFVVPNLAHVVWAVRA